MQTLTDNTVDPAVDTALFEYLLRLGDDSLVLGHRLSEWCGHGPALEEDIALANVALDLVGQAKAFLDLAGEVEGQNRSADDLAYFRTTIQYRNVQLAELPKGDFGYTIVRQFFYSAFAYLRYEALQQSTHEALAGIAAKAFKEIRYHLRHSSEWIIRLGDGTEASHQRVQDAVDALWGYIGELFETDAVDHILIEGGYAPDAAAFRDRWLAMIGQVFEQATLTHPPDEVYMHTGGRNGRHTEHLGHMLAEMQILPRSFPDAQW